MLQKSPVSAFAFDTIKDKISWTHDSILGLTADLSQKGFARQAGPFAPSIGWHVWHLARYADRLQANLNETAELWESGRYTEKWVLDPESLGPLNNGLAMPPGKTAEVVENAGKEEILQYAADVFASVAAGLSTLYPETLEEIRPSAFRYEWQAGKVTPQPERVAPLGEDLVRYFGHASRHLGMIEALLGAVFEIEGTASI